MELVIAVALGGIAIWLAYRALNKENANGRHPLDALTKKVDSSTTVVNNKTGEPVVDLPATASAESKVTEVLDVNKDGKVDLKDAVEVVKKTRARVKKAADLDGDGKVTVKDVKTAVKATKKAAAKMKPAAEPPKRGRSKKS